jgi:hypothetical protein
MTFTGPAAKRLRVKIRNLIRLAPETLHVVIAAIIRVSAVRAVAEDQLELASNTTFTRRARSRCGDPTITLTDAELEDLERTEGWKIALQMTALSLRGGF